jgi:hypothetical protein
MCCSVKIFIGITGFVLCTLLGIYIYIQNELRASEERGSLSTERAAKTGYLKFADKIDSSASSQAPISTNLFTHLVEPMRLQSRIGSNKVLVAVAYGDEYVVIYSPELNWRKMDFDELDALKENLPIYEEFLEQKWSARD